MTPTEKQTAMVVARLQGYFYGVKYLVRHAPNQTVIMGKRKRWVLTFEQGELVWHFVEGNTVHHPCTPGLLKDYNWRHYFRFIYDANSQ